MKQIVLTLTFFNLIFYAPAQSVAISEVGVTALGAYYIGDLNPFVHFKQTQPGGGLTYRLNFDQRFALRSSVAYSQVEGYDSKTGLAFQVNRNLSFKSHIFEFAAVMEFNFFDYAHGNLTRNTIGGNTRNRSAYLSPYMFGGVAFFRMNPKGRLPENDTWVELQPLGTEGQGSENNNKRPYSLGQLAIPFGVGTKCNVGKYGTLALEYGLRKTFTDFLDDVSGSYVDPDALTLTNGPLANSLSDQSLSTPGYPINGTQRGFSNNKDWYVFTSLHLTFRIGNKNLCPAAK